MTRDDFHALALSVGAGPFDLMLVGDGSGTQLFMPHGWCCLSFHVPSGEVASHHGGASFGTSNHAELTAYVHALWAHHAEQSLRVDGLRPTVRVLVVSDSELTVKCGRGQYARRANLPLWASIDWFCGVGYRFDWRWIPRLSHPLNSLADKTATRARKALTW